MGRKSKLTDKQWEQLGKRLLEGEGARALGREFGVSDATIRERFSTQHKKIKEVANQIVAAEVALSQLPISSQISTHTLADQLRMISGHLSSAALNNAAQSSKISKIALARISRFNESTVLDEETIMELKGIAGLNRMSNEASEIGINLMRANKEMLDDENKRLAVPPDPHLRITLVKAA